MSSSRPELQLIEPKADEPLLEGAMTKNNIDFETDEQYSIVEAGRLYEKTQQEINQMAGPNVIA